MSQPDNADDRPVWDQPVWDQRAAVESVGDAALARRLLHQLCAGLPDELAELRRLYAAGELTATAEHAHHVSGGAAYCGVMALRSSLKTLERQARGGDAAATGRALEALAGQVERLIAHEQVLG